MKRNLVAVLAIACCAVVGFGVTGALAAPSTGAHAQPVEKRAQGTGACPDGTFCYYNLPHYTEEVHFLSCAEGPTTLPHMFYAAINNCHNRTAQLIYNASSLPITCMNAGGERPNPSPEFDRVWIGAIGSVCSG